MSAEFTGNFRRLGEGCVSPPADEKFEQFVKDHKDFERDCVSQPVET